MAKKLELQFVNTQDKTITVSLDAPVEPIDTILVNQAMDEIIAQNIFTSTGGDLIAKKGARLVERNVSEVTL